MSTGEFVEKARTYLETLCSAERGRSAGSKDNRIAVDFFVRTMGPWGYTIDAMPFDCLDFWNRGASLACDGRPYDIYSSPFSPGCDITSGLVTVSTVAELEQCACMGKILLMKGALCAGQLMPRNHPFYNPDEHKRIYALLDAKRPAGIVAATGKNPSMAGALYPYPLIEDGDFDIPSAYSTDTVGDNIAADAGKTFRLAIDAGRIPSTARNIIATKNPDAPQKIVICAHIDTKATTRGAIDNASGTVVLLLLAEMLGRYDGKTGIEIVAINGEDHYSAGGEIDYLARYGNGLDRVSLVINIDGIGYVKGDTAFSFYGCPGKIMQKARKAFGMYPGLTEGDQWYAGDHMVFVQGGRPAIALTSERAAEVAAELLHSPRDTPDRVDCTKLVEAASAIVSLVTGLETKARKRNGK